MNEERMEECSRCREKWFRMKIRDGICTRCQGKDKTLKEDDPFFFSAANKMDSGDIPLGIDGNPLPELTQMEEMAIALCHPQIIKGFGVANTSTRATVVRSCKTTCGLSTLFPLSPTTLTLLYSSQRKILIKILDAAGSLKEISTFDAR